MQNGNYFLTNSNESCNAELSNSPEQLAYKRTNCNERGECFYEPTPLTIRKKITVNQPCNIFISDVIGLIDQAGKIYECSPRLGV